MSGEIPQADPGTVPPRLAVAGQKGSWLGRLGAVALGLVVVALFCFNPAEHAFYPRCAFHQMTGWQCPGCGGLRAMHQLLHGHLLVALKFNALAVLALPLVGAWLWREHFRAGVRHRGGWVWLACAALVVFGVLRNLPAFAWLRP